MPSGWMCKKIPGSLTKLANLWLPVRCSTHWASDWPGGLSHWLISCPSLQHKMLSCSLCSEHVHVFVNKTQTEISNSGNLLICNLSSLHCTVTNLKQEYMNKYGSLICILFKYILIKMAKIKIIIIMKYRNHKRAVHEEKLL